MTENLTLDNGCPDCGCCWFLRGPSGGASINVCCSNPQCRSAFNDMGALGAERISNTVFRSAFPDNPIESEYYKS